MRSLDSIDDRLKTSVPGIATALLQLAGEWDPKKTAEEHKLTQLATHSCNNMNTKSIRKRAYAVVWQSDGNE